MWRQNNAVKNFLLFGALRIVHLLLPSASWHTEQRVIEFLFVDRDLPVDHVVHNRSFVLVGHQITHEIDAEISNIYIKSKNSNA